MANATVLYISGDMMAVAILPCAPGIPWCQIWAKQADLRIANELIFSREGQVTPAQVRPAAYSKLYDNLSPIVRGRCTVMAGV